MTQCSFAAHYLYCQGECFFLLHSIISAPTTTRVIIPVAAIFNLDIKSGAQNPH